MKCMSYLAQNRVHVDIENILVAFLGLRQRLDLGFEHGMEVQASILYYDLF